jgi:hypothetical protein
MTTTNLSIDRLKTIAAWREKYGENCNVVIPSEEAELMANTLIEILQLKPVGSFHITEQQVEATTDYCRDGEWPIDDGELFVYALPCLAKEEWNWND